MEQITFKISIESNLSYLPLLRKTIRAVCSSVVENEKVFQDIDLCLNEALSNIIHHAYQNKPDEEIQVIVTILPNEIMFQIIDLGLNFQMTQPEPLKVDVNNIDSLPESGRGLFLIYTLMDEVSYKHESNRNILVLRKYF